MTMLVAMFLRKSDVKMLNRGFWWAISERGVCLICGRILSPCLDNCMAENSGVDALREKLKTLLDENANSMPVQPSVISEMAQSGARLSDCAPAVADPFPAPSVMFATLPSEVAQTSIPIPKRKTHLRLIIGCSLLVVLLLVIVMCICPRPPKDRSKKVGRRGKSDTEEEEDSDDNMSVSSTENPPPKLSASPLLEAKKPTARRAAKRVHVDAEEDNDTEDPLFQSLKRA